MKKKFLPNQREELISTLKTRFEKNINRHKVIDWAKVQFRLCGMEAGDKKLWSLNECK